MRVIHLSLSDFRNYQSAEVGLRPGHNLIVGRNGQGKTNLVEAIAYFGSLDSHRVGSESALIRSGTDSAVARMRIGVDQREASLEIELNRGRANRARVNGNGVRPRELTRWFSAVVFAPEDLMIVRGEPALRRRFLDEAIVARNPALAVVLSDYDRVLRQRTALLKSARANRGAGRGSGRAPAEGNALDATLEVWDSQLVEFGSWIIAERRRLIHDLRRPLISGYTALVGNDHRPEIELSESISPNVSRETHPAYPVSAPDVSRETVEALFRDALAEARSQELERGVTLVGPHRDDIVMRLNGLPVKGYASHGESWSFALALRLALAALLREESAAGDPVVILDDVFAELDSGRRRRLMEAVGDYEQVIVTAAVPEDVPEASRETGGDGSDETGPADSAESVGTSEPAEAAESAVAGVNGTWHTIRVVAGRIVGDDATVDDDERAVVDG